MRYICRGTIMQLHCNDKNYKPGKNEIITLMPRTYSYKNCPDCDKKRSTVCKDPNCGSQKR